jgi:RNA polymerase sigma-70 factor (ECF subfamily)
MAAEPSDRALVERLVRARDPAAFHALYARHTPMLFAVAFRLTQSQADAEDAVHDTWVRAVERLRGFEWRSALRTWLTAVLLNRVREEIRAASRTEHVELDDVLAVEPAELPGAVDAIDLERALSAMPLRYREVVLLHDLEGFTHQEIAMLLGIETGTSKSQLSRGRRWLREHLQNTKGGVHG